MGPHADPLLPQTENGVLLPSLQSALPFLDLHGTPRLEFHQSVFDELRDKLLERVSAIALEGKAEERCVRPLLSLGTDLAVLTAPLAPHPHPKRGPLPRVSCLWRLTLLAVFCLGTGRQPLLTGSCAASSVVHVFPGTRSWKTF